MWAEEGCCILPRMFYLSQCYFMLLTRIILKTFFDVSGLLWLDGKSHCKEKPRVESQPHSTPRTPLTCHQTHSLMSLQEEIRSWIFKIYSLNWNSSKWNPSISLPNPLMKAIGVCLGVSEQICFDQCVPRERITQEFKPFQQKCGLNYVCLI